MTAPNSTEEIWLPVPYYEREYDVSNFGRVRSVVRVVEDKNGITRFLPGKELRIKRNSSGYPCVHLYRSGEAKGTYFAVHTLVLSAFVGLRPEGMECLHRDGDPENSYVGNLHWDTRKENAQDTLRHGRNFSANKTSCPQGHPYDDLNTYRAVPGRRTCLICHRGSARVSMRRLRAAWKVAA